MADELELAPTQARSSPQGPDKLKKRESKWKQMLSNQRSDTAVIEFRDLTYSVSVPKPPPPGEKPKARKPWQKAEMVDKAILKHITGFARPGQLLAIMGPSGAGKTTLMNLLAGRLQLSGKLEGELLFNGEKLDRRALKGISGYVLQDDLLHPHLTVRESLEYATLSTVAPLTAGPQIRRAFETSCEHVEEGQARARGAGHLRAESQRVRRHQDWQRAGARHIGW